MKGGVVNSDKTGDVRDEGRLHKPTLKLVELATTVKESQVSNESLIICKEMKHEFRLNIQELYSAEAEMLKKRRINVCFYSRYARGLLTIRGFLWVCVPTVDHIDKETDVKMRNIRK